MTKLTTETLLAIASPSAGERIELRDPAEPGLIFRVSPSGAKSWSVRYLNNVGEHRRKTIGAFPTIGIVRARQLARQIKGSTAEGEDPVGQEKEARAEVQRARMNTLDGLFEEYIADAKIGMHRVNGRAKRPSTMYQMERNFDRLLRPTLGNRAVASINRRDILDLVAQKSRLARSNGFYIQQHHAAAYALRRTEGDRRNQPGQEYSGPTCRHRATVCWPITNCGRSGRRLTMLHAFDEAGDPADNDHAGARQ